LFEGSRNKSDSISEAPLKGVLLIVYMFVNKKSSAFSSGLLEEKTGRPRI
jgi:hypothetical protein